MHSGENHEQLTPPSIEQLRQGNGFQEIIRTGWDACRTAILRQTSYSEWIQAYLDQRTPFHTSAERDAPSLEHDVEAVTANRAAFIRAQHLSTKLQTNLGPGIDHPALAWQDRSKKLFFQARKKFPPNQKITRLYISVLSSQAPEAFRALCRASLHTGGYEQAQIVFNLENYQEEGLAVPVDNNTIIAYVHGNDPENVNKMIRAIEEAREEAPAAWHLPIEFQEKLRAQALKELLLPLDEQVSLVEQMGSTSYHHDIYPALYEEVIPGGDLFGNTKSLPEMVQATRHFGPSRPVYCEKYELRNRLRHMPALIARES